MGAKLRPLTAEFIGTFGLVFIGGGAVVVNEARSGALGLTGVALANAMVLATMVTARSPNGASSGPGSITFIDSASSTHSLERSPLRFDAAPRRHSTIDLRMYAP